MKTITMTEQEYEASLQQAREEAISKGNYSKNIFYKLMDEFADKYGKDGQRHKVRAAVAALTRAKYNFRTPTGFPTAKADEVRQYIRKLLDLTYQKGA